MSRYGVPYQGSKNSIAPWIVEHLPAGDTLVDLFAGGCAITHRAMEIGKYRNYIINDIDTAPELFMQALRGEITDDMPVPTREEFFLLKETNPFIKWVYSFGNNGLDYIYGADIEELKVIASQMLTRPTLKDRYRHYRHFIKKLQLGKGNDTSGLQQIEWITRAQGLENVQSLQRLQRLQMLQGLQAYRLDYQDVPIPHGGGWLCIVTFPTWIPSASHTKASTTSATTTGWTALTSPSTRASTRHRATARALPRLHALSPWATTMRQAPENRRSAKVCTSRQGSSVQMAC